ncbi:hypothetical protein BA177_07030 [Woeseia oceani]|uniref:Uncharacterized protein n=1 Tax=Woeseia oceani TaxID=1548547 RepID=A0A193LEN9_9GAMM|nr:hypothetical protein BA177_07030 [Woeseia oceani]
MVPEIVTTELADGDALPPPPQAARIRQYTAADRARPALHLQNVLVIIARALVGSCATEFKTVPLIRIL